MRRLTVFPLIIQTGNTFPDHVNISRILVWKSNRQFQKYVMDLFEVVKCSTPMYKGRYMHNFKGLKYKCESPDSPVELFSYQHLFNCATGINIRVNQQVAKPSICPLLRVRPFNLKGGVMVFCFVQNFFLGQHKS
jgi:hypothetical protein